MPKPWHAMNPDEVLKELGVGREGLSSEEALERLKKHGYNELVERKKTGPL
ncbi:MAG: cation-transporting P-type ATPase, partial [Thermoproteota archaeon]